MATAGPGDVAAAAAAGFGALAGVAAVPPVVVGLVAGAAVAGTAVAAADVGVAAGAPQAESATLAPTRMPAPKNARRLDVLLFRNFLLLKSFDQTRLLTE